MSKNEMVKIVASNTGLTNKDVSAVVDNMIVVIKDTLSKGDKVTINGFVSFYKRHESAKKGVLRMKDEKEWSVPERDIVAVKVSDTYKDI